jgi:hypothetical protein
MAAPSAFSLLAVAVPLLLGLVQPAATSPPAPPPAARPRGGGTAPENCSWTLYQLYSCGGFLSTGTALAGPPASCYSNLRATLSTPDSICLCHLYGGGFNDISGINVDPLRLALLPIVCLAIVPPQLPYMCFGKCLYIQCLIICSFRW